MNVSLRHSTNFNFKLLGSIDLVVQCFQLISWILRSPVITICEYFSPDVVLISFDEVMMKSKMLKDNK